MSWRVGISSGACTDRPIFSMLPAIRDAGATGVEIGTPPRHFDPREVDQISTLRGALDDLALSAVSIHAPFGGSLDLAHPDPQHRDGAIGAILGAAAALKRLGGRLVIVHPSDLERHGQDVGARLADIASSLKTLADRCRQEHMTLVVESPLPHLIGGAPDEFRWLLKQLPSSVRVCLDTGHTFLGGHWHSFLNVCDGRLAHVHANDNHGTGDDHLIPGEGRIDWADVGRTLTAVGFAEWVMLELRCPPGDPRAYFRRALERTVEVMGNGV
jgi:sugar phosphate isomerase/epimerase